MLQGCQHNVVIICYIKHITGLSEQPCNMSDNFGKVVTSCQQVVQKCWQLATSSAKTTCSWRLVDAQVVTGLQTSCYKSVDNLSTSCVPTACSQLFQQVCNKLLTTCNEAWWNYQNCYKVVLTSLIRSWYNKDITSLSTQGCNNLLYQARNGQNSYRNFFYRNSYRKNSNRNFIPNSYRNFSYRNSYRKFS